MNFACDTEAGECFQRCTQNAHCRPGYACAFQRCKLGCRTLLDRACNGYVCDVVRGICSDYCLGDQNCGRAYRCEAMRCMPKPCDIASVISQCGGFDCSEEGVCYTACTGDEQCSSRWACDASEARCRAPCSADWECGGWRCGPAQGAQRWCNESCRSDADCNPMFVCRNSGCVMGALPQADAGVRSDAGVRAEAGVISDAASGVDADLGAARM